MGSKRGIGLPGLEGGTKIRDAQRGERGALLPEAHPGVPESHWVLIRSTKRILNPYSC